MSRPSRVPVATALTLVAIAVAQSASAQSVLAARGIGFPIEPVDARGRALGSVGVGLFGTGLGPLDPTGIADLSVPTITLTMQNAWLDVVDGDDPSSVSGNRFPAFGVSYPVRDWGVVSLTYGAVLDQRWAHTREDTVAVGESGRLAILDRFTSEGGVAAVRLGFARRVSPSLAVGASVGTFTGSSSRIFTRLFDTLSATVNIAPYQISGRWRYSGPTASIGTTVDLGRFVRGAASLTWSGELEADPSDETLGPARSYDMPLDVRAGLSGRLAPELSAQVGLAWTDWSETVTGFDVGVGDVGSVLSLGAGIEWEGSTLFGRGFPIRLGWRRTELPYAEDGEVALESALTGGVGFALLDRSDGLPLGRIELAVERGNRSVGSLDEDFWRSTLSLRVAGF